MDSIAQHVTVRLRVDRVIAETTSARRLLARVVLRLGRPFRLLGFRAVDTHLHLQPATGRTAAAELARRIEGALTRRLRLPGFEQARIRPVRDQAHLFNVFRYIHTQDQHHGFGDDPFHDASSLPDLLGLRVLGSDTPGMVRALLPRVDRAMLLQWLGAPALDHDQPVPIDLLPDAAAAAVAAPTLVGRHAAVQVARAAVAQIAASRMTAVSTARVLGVCERTVRRLRRSTVPDAITLAVRLQARLRALKRAPALRLLPEEDGA